MSGKKCWLCGIWYLTDHCPECGPPQPYGPTAAEMREQERLAEARHDDPMEDFRECDCEYD